MVPAQRLLLSHSQPSLKVQVQSHYLASLGPEWQRLPTAHQNLYSPLLPKSKIPAFLLVRCSPLPEL